MKNFLFLQRLCLLLDGGSHGYHYKPNDTNASQVPVKISLEMLSEPDSARPIAMDYGLFLYCSMHAKFMYGTILLFISVM